MKKVVATLAQATQPVTRRLTARVHEHFSSLCIARRRVYLALFLAFSLSSPATRSVAFVTGTWFSMMVESDRTAIGTWSCGSVEVHSYLFSVFFSPCLGSPSIRWSKIATSVSRFPMQISVTIPFAKPEHPMYKSLRSRSSRKRERRGKRAEKREGGGAVDDEKKGSDGQIR
jgi:hypothetical protein